MNNMKNFLRIRSVSRNRTEESENEDANDGGTANVTVMDRKELESLVLELQKKLKYALLTQLKDQEVQGRLAKGHASERRS